MPTQSGSCGRVPDVRVVHTVDVYENQLLRTYHDQVVARLRRVAAALQTRNALAPLVEAHELLQELTRARRQAAFLDEVGRLTQAPTRVTMILLKRPEYRSLLGSYLRFRRSAYVHLEDPALATPLENLPHLYELWVTLAVIDAVLEAGAEAGYQVRTQRLARHVDGGVYLSVLADGNAALRLRHPVTGDRISVVPQRTYTRGSGRVRSISFSQIPDVTVEIRRHSGQTDLYLFDPKYKLRSEELGEVGDGRPKKIDIDTMHAYRDALRDLSGARLVRYAAILYPGPTVVFTPGLAALSARPDESGSLRQQVRAVLTSALTQAD